MRYTVVPVTPFEQNCTIFWCEKTRRAVVIDPGGDIEDVVLPTIRQNGILLKEIWLTHGHLDHAGGALELKEALGIPVIVIDRPRGDSLVGAQHIRERKGQLVTRTKMATPFHGCQVEWDVCQSTPTSGLH